ncbi:alpha-crystallin A chain [Tribolium castaneum]|uniref:Protein lethal(2)essential for life-like Protein n=1 Tax=Tribolium castaneum TaxID=7070 RepID=D6WV45_TRICA|nr:PREDICTED: alpha-crystallin A chain [Tribolium castaneum]EFA07781.1 Protein lethal(2)essential for life-like Protein [Tribolium castaneum]|eukprot:XP_974367.1 PREDICTED: alpha-crystallin A chain [Tribolium castaneum]
MALWLYTDPFDFYRPAHRFLERWFDPEDLFPRDFRLLQDHGSSDINFDKDKFQANIDVQQFRPEEITVKVSDDTVTVEGKHEEKRDEHGYISRHFVRKYVLPKGHDVNRVESKLSSDGVLTITAPKVGDGKEQEKSIPVVQTGQPTPAVQQKQEEKK